MTTRTAGIISFESLLTDLRQVFRQICNAPGFTIAAVLVLASGFAASTAIFSAVRTVLLAPLPYTNPDRLVQVISRWPKTGDKNGWSAPLGDLSEMKVTVAGLQDVAAYRYSLLNLKTGGEAESLYGVRVTANLLPMLGVRPQLGTWIPAEDDRPGNTHTLLLSDDLWRRAFHADPNIVGKTVRLDEQDYLVLGVMPRGFNFPMKLATTALLPTDQMQFWMPLGADFSKEPHGAPNAGVVARIKEGVQLAQAQEQLEAACRLLAREYPATNTNLSAVLVSLQQQTVGQVSASLLALLAGAGLILLLGCTNVAALLLARGESRVGELAIRMALGASAGRVACLPALFGFLLCGFGCVLGVPLAMASLRVLIRLAPVDVPRLDTAAIDWQALLFSAALAFFCGTLVGGLNALQVLRRSPREVLSDVSLGITGRTRARLRSSLVVGQVAIAVLLVAGAGLMLRTFLNLLSTDTGYEPDRVLYGVTVLPQARYPKSEQMDLFFREVLDRLRAASGIEYAAVSTGFPFVGQYDEVRVKSPALTNGNINSGVSADFNSVSPGYLETMGVRLLQGRLISENDTEATPNVAVIDQMLGRTLWPGESPLGKLINTGDPAKPVWRQVVGVVVPMHNRSLDVEPRPGVFVPLRQAGGWVNFVVLKSTLGSTAAVRLLREAVSAADPDQGVFFTQSMPQLIGGTIAIRRFLFMVLAFFGGSAVFLSGLGLYSLITFLAASRVREVGIRMALGATRAGIASLVVSYGVRLTLMGVAAGTLASLLLGHLLSGLLFGVRSFDLPTILVAVTMLTATTGIAALVPAWRISRMNPMKALRNE